MGEGGDRSAYFEVRPEASQAMAADLDRFDVAKAC